jgi:hypothetical protein
MWVVGARVDLAMADLTSRLGVCFHLKLRSKLHLSPRSGAMRLREVVEARVDLAITDLTSRLGVCFHLKLRSKLHLNPRSGAMRLREVLPALANSSSDVEALIFF